ncbi:MAG: Glu-tRNA(Gln) amidotransferase subunit GatE [Candidatus Diapherotrites archaeon]|uniref:Glutamyl-tRNA(Gln) amidotransferase subunit E n=1 Tax=Candidatus Iainarchaeum sp. TaxID=3101447 RepID=A0A8T4CAT0_9ARCH|nr:Glu-tRNA(Gln) amidotransferase subunit GatE [Candidatus Diapherotrites archaeon]
MNEFSKHPVTCGLEIHQQLDTGKLFSRTPTTLRDDAPEFTFKRKLHAVASETGKMDAAALEAMHKKQTFIYQGHHENTSLVETDEEPPHTIDEDALNVALEVSLLCNASIVDTMLVMRKTVIDGSNTSGFQRTAQVSFGGHVTLDDGTPIRVQGIAIEEDSARPMEKKDHEITYRLDRLGFPLIELATMPDIHTPEQAKQTALKIGEVMRITGQVKRGLGSIRQDINISVPGGARVELKGVQELDLIDEYVRREMQRQNVLLEMKEVLKKEGLTHEMVNSQAGMNITKIVEKYPSKMIQTALQKKQAIYAVRLPYMHGRMGKEVQPGRRIGSEISSYVKARAGLQGLLHGDENLSNYGFTSENITEIRTLTHCHEKDSFAIVMGEEGKCKHAIDVIKHRVAQLLEGVPEETRNALEGGNSEYSRPLPGAARMYPETDADDIRVNENMLRELSKDLPRWANERKTNYIKRGLSEKLAEEMKLDNKARFFEKLLTKGYDPTTTATLLLNTLSNVHKEKPLVNKLTEKQLEELLSAEKNKKVLREKFGDVLKEWSDFPQEKLETILSRMKMENADEGEIERVIRQIMDKNQHLIIAKGMNSQQAFMGLAMQALRGKAQGYFIAQAVEKELKKRTGKD